MWKEYYNEELQDYKKYMELAEKLDKEYPQAGGILRDMAEEERQHSEHIKRMMEHIGNIDTVPKDGRYEEIEHHNPLNEVEIIIGH